MTVRSGIFHSIHVTNDASAAVVIMVTSELAYIMLVLDGHQTSCKSAVIGRRLAVVQHKPSIPLTPTNFAAAASPEQRHSLTITKRNIRFTNDQPSVFICRGKLSNIYPYRCRYARRCEDSILVF